MSRATVGSVSWSTARWTALLALTGGCFIQPAATVSVAQHHDLAATAEVATGMGQLACTDCSPGLMLFRATRFVVSAGAAELIDQAGMRVTEPTLGVGLRLSLPSLIPLDADDAPVPRVDFGFELMLDSVLSDAGDGGFGAGAFADVALTRGTSHPTLRIAFRHVDYGSFGDTNELFLGIAWTWTQYARSCGPDARGAAAAALGCALELR